MAAAAAVGPRGDIDIIPYKIVPAEAGPNGRHPKSKSVGPAWVSAKAAGKNKTLSNSVISRLYVSTVMENCDILLILIANFIII